MRADEDAAVCFGVPALGFEVAAAKRAVCFAVGDKCFAGLGRAFEDEVEAVAGLERGEVGVPAVGDPFLVRWAVYAFAGDRPAFVVVRVSADQVLTGYDGL